ncbi:MAG TPA: hypothetical protein V6D12_08180 [Candidatus Obscuribacterales bacterium]
MNLDSCLLAAFTGTITFLNREGDSQGDPPEGRKRNACTPDNTQA